MSTGVSAVIVAVVIVIGAVVFGAMAVSHRRRLQRDFGPEYARLAGERGSWREAEVELAGRERRVRGLGIQPLTDAARASYAGHWAGIEERFAGAPAHAVFAARILVAAVMTERGYPAGQHDQDQVLADLSVDHSGVLARYRAAEVISGRAAAGTASTEDLGQAMADYHALFADLLGEPADEGVSPAPAAVSTSQQFTVIDPAETAK
jgi:hypothetical protein